MKAQVREICVYVITYKSPWIRYCVDIIALLSCLLSFFLWSCCQHRQMYNLHKEIKHSNKLENDENSWLSYFYTRKNVFANFTSSRDRPEFAPKHKKDENCKKIIHPTSVKVHTRCRVVFLRSFIYHFSLLFQVYTSLKWDFEQTLSIGFCPFHAFF